MSETKHTPGPWNLMNIYDHGVIVDTRYARHLAKIINGAPETKANARLIIASSNSYTKHCGSQAVECAEGDLLGELLEALENSDSALGLLGIGKDGKVRTKNREAIAKAKGESNA